MGLQAYVLLVQRPGLEKLGLCLMSHNMLQPFHAPKSRMWALLLEMIDCLTLIVLHPGELVWEHNIIVNANGYMQLGKWHLYINLALLKETVFGWGGGTRQFSSKQPKISFLEFVLLKFIAHWQNVRAGCDIRDHLVKPPHFTFEKLRPKREEKLPQGHTLVTDKRSEPRVPDTIRAVVPRHRAASCLWALSC